MPMRRSAGWLGVDPKARVGVKSVTQLAVLAARGGSPLPVHRPADVLADDRRGIVGASRQRGHDALVRGRVAERHGDVAEPAFIAGAAQRRPGRARLPLLLRPREQAYEAGTVEAVADREVADVRRSRELVPGAKELAIVAAENP